MKLAVVGANGKSGTQVVLRARALGHDVVAIVRRPETVTATEGVIVKRADVMDPASLVGVFDGVDAVVSCIGPASMRNVGTVMSTGTAHLVAATAAAGVRRYVFESGLFQSDGSELSGGGRFLLRLMANFVQPLIKDKALAEAAITRSELDWVIVRPPGLSNASATGNYVAGPRARVALTKTLSHADCADCLIRATHEPAWTRQIVNVGH